MATRTLMFQDVKGIQRRRRRFWVYSHCTGQVHQVSTIFDVDGSRPEMMFQCGFWWGGQVFSMDRFSGRISIVWCSSGRFRPFSTVLPVNRKLYSATFPLWRTCFLDGLRLSDGGTVNYVRWTHGGWGWQVRKAISEMSFLRRLSCDAPGHDI